MKQLRALCELWICIIGFRDENLVFVHAGKQHPERWSQVGDDDQFIHLQEGDYLTFSHVDKKDNPYVLAEKYPEWFELVP